VLLDPKTIAAYQRDGVVVIPNLVDAKQLEQLRQGVAENMASPGPWANEYTPQGTAGRFFDDYVNWQRIQQFSEVTPWHHDDPYYGIDGIDNVSIWVPLDPIPDSVALRFIAGSHKWNKRFIPKRFKDQTAYVESAHDFVHLPSVEELNAHEVISTPVQLGDAVAFHYRTLHSAPGTAGTGVQLRRAVSFRYVGDDAVFATRPWKTSPPLEANGLKPGDALEDPRFPIVASR
jgi:ectoine hydroxylase-related dioxygenase (phytanoyl-CoA dioxygenase family)